MEHSKVYIRIHYLLFLRDAPVSERNTALRIIIPSQVELFSVIATRMINGVVLLSRRDAPLIRRKRRLLRTLASTRVSFIRKKALLRRYHALVPVLLRTPYLIQVILDEIRTARDE